MAVLALLHRHSLSALVLSCLHDGIVPTTRKMSETELEHSLERPKYYRFSKISAVCPFPTRLQYGISYLIHPCDPKFVNFTSVP